MNPCEFFLGYCKHAERIIVPQILLDRERKLGKVRQRFAVIRMNTRCIKSLFVVRYILVGVIKGLFETIQLQR